MKSDEKSMLDHRQVGNGEWRSSVFAHDGLLAQTNPEKRLYLHYLAVMSLLGRVCGQTDKYASEVARAFEDANIILGQRDSDVYFEKCFPNGYSLFDKKVKS